MKKFVSVVAVFLMLSLSACSNQSTAHDGADYTSNSESENTIMLDEGVWPENEYTDGLPVPPGTVSWAMSDTEHGNCSVSITDIDENAYRDYMVLLKQNGFSVTNNVSEEIKGQDYVSIGTLLSDGSRWLSIGYTPDNLVMYISFEELTDISQVQN